MIIPYGKQEILQEDIDKVVEVLKSDFLTQGPEIGAFEKTVAEYHGAKYAVAFSNGTAALHGAYSCVGISEGDEIITSPITFAASANGALYCGGKPVFADIDKNTNCIDIEQIEGKITPKTKVITPVAYAGFPVDLKSIREIADRHGCRVIYDAAHAIGSRRGGSFGMEYIDAAILSFHPVKHIAAGEGGMILTNDEELFHKLQLFRSHGITKDPELLEDNHGGWYYEMQSLGYNYRITDIQCALANSQFKRIDDNLIRRNKIAKAYDEMLAGSEFVDVPPSVGYEVLNTKDPAKTADLHSYHLYTVAMKDPGLRKEMYEYLRSKGVLVQIHYVPVHLQPYYKKNFGYKPGDCPIAEDFYSREISLPMFHALKEDEQEYVVDCIKNFK